MLLKRVIENGRVMGVRALRAGAVQKFTFRYISTGMKEGWLTIAGGIITINVFPTPYKYAIQRPPGVYCCFCEKPLYDSLVAKQHMLHEHPSKPSPDPSHPTGYRRDNFYYAVRTDPPPEAGMVFQTGHFKNKS